MYLVGPLLLLVTYGSSYLVLMQLFAADEAKLRQIVSSFRTLETETMVTGP